MIILVNVYIFYIIYNKFTYIFMVCDTKYIFHSNCIYLLFTVCIYAPTGKTAEIVFYKF